MFNIIIWSIAGITTLFIKDAKVLKFNFCVTWVILMAYLITYYMG